MYSAASLQQETFISAKRNEPDELFLYSMSDIEWLRGMYSYKSIKESGASSFSLYQSCMQELKH